MKTDMQIKTETIIGRLPKMRAVLNLGGYKFRLTEESFPLVERYITRLNSHYHPNRGRTDLVMQILQEKCVFLESKNSFMITAVPK